MINAEILYEASHGLITFVIMSVAIFFGTCATIVAGVSLFLMWGMREATQAEYKGIQKAGGRRADIKWYTFALPENWDKHSFIANWMVPGVIALVFITTSILIY